MSQPINEFGRYDITLGVLIGIGATFGSYWITEYLKNRRFRNNVKKMVRVELSYYRTFLEALIKNGTDYQKNTEFLCIAFGSETAKRLNRIVTDRYNNYF